MKNKNRKNFDGLLAAWLAKLGHRRTQQTVLSETFRVVRMGNRNSNVSDRRKPHLKNRRSMSYASSPACSLSGLSKKKDWSQRRCSTKAHIQDLLKENDFDNGDAYYRAVLQNLFFATLNTEIDERQFSKGNNSDHRNPLSVSL